MNAKDKHPASTKSPKDDLLDELESIKDLLEEHDLDDDLDIDIPILDDVVGAAAKAAENAQSESTLLDLETIFDDNADDHLSPSGSDERQAPPELSEEIESLDSEESAGPAVGDIPEPTNGLNFDHLDTRVAIPSFSLSSAANLADVPAASEASSTEPVDTDPLETLAIPPAQEAPAVIALKSSLPKDEEQEEMFPAQESESPGATLRAEMGQAANAKMPSDAATARSSPDARYHSSQDFSIDLLIQELVDEFIPAVEDKLRQRLSECEPQVLRELAEKHLK